MIELEKVKDIDQICSEKFIELMGGSGSPQIKTILTHDGHLYEFSEEIILEESMEYYMVKFIGIINQDKLEELKDYILNEEKYFSNNYENNKQRKNKNIPSWIGDGTKIYIKLDGIEKTVESNRALYKKLTNKIYDNISKFKEPIIIQKEPIERTEILISDIINYRGKKFW